MTLQEVELYNRMVLDGRKPPKPTADDRERVVPIAVRMLTYIAALAYTYYDLIDELEEAGLYRQATKKVVNRQKTIIENVHNRAFNMLKTINPIASRQYNDKMEQCYRIIQSSILLKAPERSVNIVVALCRLIEKDNRAIGNKYYFAPAEVLYNIPKQLEIIGIKDYKLDQIIEISIKTQEK